MESEEDVRVSVSYTTRPPREGEKDGVDYNFVDEPAFREMIERGVFLEHANVFGNQYGTSREWVERQLAEGMDIVLEIDWQGARLVRQALSECVGIFILPPSRRELEARLQGRGQDDKAVIERRMQEAVREMSHYAEYDYLVVNDDFSAAVSDLRSIVRARRLARREQEARLEALLEDLLA